MRVREVCTPDAAIRSPFSRAPPYVLRNTPNHRASYTAVPLRGWLGRLQQYSAYIFA